MLMVMRRPKSNATAQSALLTDGWSCRGSGRCRGMRARGDGCKRSALEELFLFLLL